MTIDAIPAGAPARASGPGVWHGSELGEPSKWVRMLNGEQIRDLNRAIKQVESQGLDIDEIDATRFALPSWTELIREVRHELRRGRGFVLLRGVPVEDYSYQQSRIAFWGIGAQIGPGLTQSARADLVCDITDRNESLQKLERTYATTQGLDFHCDFPDIVGLLCLRTAAKGGGSHITSSGAVYNALLDRRPDLMPHLLNGFPWDRRNEHGDGEAPIGPRIPVFRDIHGVIHCRYGKGSILAAAQRAGVPLSPAEREAVELVNITAADPELVLTMDFRPGDVQLLNNYLILHARAAYEDHPEPEKKRHLLRLWLEDDGYRYVNHEPNIRYGVLRYGRLGLRADELRAEAG
ncbi:MAG: TauD/TfdA family dioxygenase [Burkholderiaceae bacterium]